MLNFWRNSLGEIMRKALCFGLSVILIAASAKGAFADSTGVTDTTIKIGLFGPLTGVSSAAKEIVLGVAGSIKT